MSLFARYKYFVAVVLICAVAGVLLLRKRSTPVTVGGLEERILQTQKKVENAPLAVAFKNDDADTMARIILKPENQADRERALRSILSYFDMAGERAGTEVAREALLKNIIEFLNAPVASVEPVQQPVVLRARIFAARIASRIAPHVAPEKISASLEPMIAKLPQENEIYPILLEALLRSSKPDPKAFADLKKLCMANELGLARTGLSLVDSVPDSEEKQKLVAWLASKFNEVNARNQPFAFRVLITNKVSEPEKLVKMAATKDGEDWFDAFITAVDTLSLSKQYVDRLKVVVKKSGSPTIKSRAQRLIDLSAAKGVKG